MLLPPITQPVDLLEDGISIGTNAILKTIRDARASRGNYVWDIFAINVQTLIRNVLPPGDIRYTLKQTAEKLVFEMGTIANYIRQYCEVDVMNPLKPVAVFYFPHYHIPEEYARTQNSQALKLAQFTDKLSKGFKPKEFCIGNLKVIHGHFHSKLLQPHQLLQQYLSKTDKSFSRRSVVMASSFPIDYHFSKFVHTFHLLRSHTGELVPTADLGRVVFSKYPVPFNKYTHILLGDSKLLKPQLTPKNKKVLVEFYAKNKLKYQPEHVVKVQLVRNGLATDKLLSFNI